MATVLPGGVVALDDLWLSGGGAGYETGESKAGDMIRLHTTDSGMHWTQSRPAGRSGGCWDDVLEAPAGDMWASEGRGVG